MKITFLTYLFLPNSLYLFMANVLKFMKINTLSINILKNSSKSNVFFSFSSFYGCKEYYDYVSKRAINIPENVISKIIIEYVIHRIYGRLFMILS